MAMSSLGLGFVFSAKDLASAKIRGLGSTIQRFTSESESAALRYEKNMRRVKSGAMMLGAGVVGLAGINRISKSYESFEQSLVKAGTIMGATSKEMTMLKKAGIQAGIATQFSPDEAVSGLENLGAAGMNAAQSIETLNPVLGLASAGQLSVAESASVVVGVLNAFGETTDMAGKRVDQLVRVFQRSNFQARDFQIALSQASAQAKAADQSFESMLATLGLLRNTNLDASSAATAYREAVRRLSGDQQAQKKLAQLHVDALDKQTGKIKDLSQIILELQPRLEKLNAKERNLALTKMFGVRGMKTYNAVIMGYQKLLKEGKVQVGDYAGAHRMLVGELNKSNGAMEEARKKFLQTAAGQRILLQGSWQTFKVVAGETFTPVLLPALQGAVSVLNKLIGVIQAIPAPIKTMFAQFAGFSAVALSLVGTMRLLSGAMGIFSMAGKAGKWIEAQQALNNETYAAKTGLDAAAKGTGKWAKMNSKLAGTLGKIGAALPYIGIAAAAVSAVYNAITADDQAMMKRREEYQQMQKRMAIETAADYAKMAQAAVKTRDAALQAAEALVKKALANRGIVQKTAVQVQAELMKSVDKRNKLAAKLANVNISIGEMSSLGGGNKERDEALMKERNKLMKEIALEDERFKAKKWAYFRLRGLRAEQLISQTTDAKKREELQRTAAAGYIAQAKGEAKRIKEIQKKLSAQDTTTAIGRDIANTLRKQIADTRSRMKGYMGRAARLTGVANLPPAERRRMLERMTRGLFAETRGYESAESRNKLMSAASTGSIPENLSLAETTRLLGMVNSEQGQYRFERRFQSAGAAGGTYYWQKYVKRLEEMQRIQMANYGQGAYTAERHITVNLNVDGKKLASTVVSANQDNTSSEGGTSGAGGV